jgi:crotonobetainyl-CoA:carnitine CoA-transferase CaiB-like acyl-CoA transferase
MTIKGGTSGKAHEVRDHLDSLLRSIGIDPAETGGLLSIEGQEPDGLSPHRLASASAVALAAQGAGVAALWRRRSARGQDVTVSMADAMHALRALTYVEQNGVSPSFGRSLPLIGYHRASDGRWITFATHHGHPHHFDGVLELLDCAPTTEACARAVARWDSIELEDAAAAKRLPVGVARSPEEWSAHPQGQWLGARPVIEIERIGDGPPVPVGVGIRPLSGIRVLDMTHVIGGPMLSRSFAEQGADVLHIGDPSLPDPPLLMLDTSMGKRTAYLDLNRDEQARTFRDLASQADVFVQSWRPGVLEKFGVSPAELAAIRPGIVCVSVSCFGSGGPWAGRGGFDHNAQAVTGISLTESKDGRPRPPLTNTVNDYLIASLGAAGALAALLRRDSEGGSYHVRVSLARCSMWLQSLGYVEGWKGRSEASPFTRSPPRLEIRDSVFGKIRNLACPVHYSETPSYFERLPQPFGASQPRWL